jgi:hypothetical protein
MIQMLKQILETKIENMIQMIKQILETNIENTIEIIKQILGIINKLVNNISNIIGSGDSPEP